MQEVLRMLETRDAVHVAELSKAFAVSEVTVRSDLSQLARQGLVARVRGGVRALERGQAELGFDFRLRLEVERKQAIARAAAAMVDEGEAIALDSSTTAYYLALELRTKKELVVVTNGLLIASALADAPGISVLVTGGMLRLQAMSLVGELGAEALRDHPHQQGLPRRARPEPRRRPHGPQPRRGAHQARDGERLRARDRHRRRHASGIARRCCRSSPPEAGARDRHRHGAPAEHVEAWQARGVEIVRVDPDESARPALRRLL